MCKIIKSFSLSKDSIDFLDKKKKDGLNISAFVDKLISDASILELEKEIMKG